MDQPTPDFRLLRFSTARLAPRERLDAWHHVLAQKLLCCEVEPLGRGQFRSDVMLRGYQNIRVGTGTISPSMHSRSRALAVAEGSSDVGLFVCLDGRIQVSHKNREGALMPGDAFAFDFMDDVTFLWRVPVRLLFVRVPTEALSRHIVPHEKMTGRIIPSEASPVALLRHYMAALFEDDDLAMTPVGTRVAIDHIVDLVALALVSPRAMTFFVASGAGRANKLTAIKADVARNLTRRDLTVDWLAARHGVSRRHLYRLLERNGMSFTAFVLEQRLNAAHRMLSDPRFAEQGIGEIALQCGFGDISHFNRMFRRRYAMAPSDVRKRNGG